jgi:thiol-disulfide isomerase/thioredoxin
LNFKSKEMKKYQSVLFIVIFFVGFYSCSSGDNKRESNTVNAEQGLENEKKSLPEFMLADVNGNVINLTSFRGKKVFVNLWATWCPPCRAEIPSIEKLHSMVNSDSTVFVMLSLDENFDAAKRFAEAGKIKLPIYYSAGPMPDLFKTDGIPATFIFNERGELIRQNMGSDDYSTDSYVSILTSNN